jgi:hypothetical protein
MDAPSQHTVSVWDTFYICKPESFTNLQFFINICKAKEMTLPPTGGFSRKNKSSRCHLFEGFAPVVKN